MEGKKSAPPLGFVLITHGKPHQIRRLIARLNVMFDNPPIVCHHDFSKCDLDTRGLGSNVSFLRPHLETDWASFAIVEATARAIELMYGAPVSPDWFVLLSGADYPIKPASRILSVFQSFRHDVDIQSIPIRENVVREPWEETCFQRYCSTVRVNVPWITRRLKLSKRGIWLRHPWLTRMFLPFSRSLRCYAGSEWFCANRRAAQRIIEFHRTAPALAAHYANVSHTDESYFQTILLNSPEIRAEYNKLWYIDWSAGGEHPKTLLGEDFAKLQETPALFARKFDADIDSSVLDELDDRILGITSHI